MIRMPVFLFFLSSIALVTSGHIHAQSDTLWNQEDTMGRKQGWWKRYYPDGGLVYRGFFRDDKPLGSLQRYYENGKRQADMDYIGGTGLARAILYYRNGELAATGNYLHRHKDSIWCYYSYYTSGLSYRETYVKGKKEGLSERYYPEGGMMEVQFWKDDMKNGSWQRFYVDSTLRLSASYKDDELHGDYRVWSPENIPLIVGSYEMGKMDGDWVFYDENGSLLKHLVYERGKLRNQESLDEWAKKYMDEVEENLGKIPEVEFENFFERK